MKKIINKIYLALFTLFISSSTSFAQIHDIGEATDDFSTKMLTLFKGPLVKILAGIVLFVGVGGLLRGKHSTAVSCGVAFILLLMLPFVLQYFGAPAH